MCCVEVDLLFQPCILFWAYCSFLKIRSWNLFFFFWVLCSDAGFSYPCMAPCNKVGIYFSPTLVFFLALDLRSKKHVLCEEKKEAACIYTVPQHLRECARC